jgi:hypothetical protein
MMDAPDGRLADEIASISAAARDMGIGPGDPAYPFVLGLERLLGQLGAKLDAHDAATAKMAEMIADTAGQKIAAAADRSARSLVEFHHEAANQASRKWFWKASAIAALVAVGLTAGAMYSGWRMADDRIAEMVNQRVQRIEGAAFVARIAELNDAASLREYCLTHGTHQEGSSFLKCSLPDVWVVAPPGKKAAAK